MIQASVNEYLLNKVDGLTKVVNQLKVITEQQNRENEDMKKQIEKQKSETNKWIKEHFEYRFDHRDGEYGFYFTPKNVVKKCEFQ